MATVTPVWAVTPATWALGLEESTAVAARGWWAREAQPARRVLAVPPSGARPVDMRERRSVVRAAEPLARAARPPVARPAARPAKAARRPAADTRAVVGRGLAGAETADARARADAAALQPAAARAERWRQAPSAPAPPTASSSMIAVDARRIPRKRRHPICASWPASKAAAPPTNCLPVPWPAWRGAVWPGSIATRPRSPARSRFRPARPASSPRSTPQEPATRAVACPQPSARPSRLAVPAPPPRPVSFIKPSWAISSIASRYRLRAGAIRLVNAWGRACAPAASGAVPTCRV